MSFLTMMGPSPDWNVGLSAEDLCTKECGWVQKVVQDLIPWDAGTDSGVTYEVCACLQCQVTDLPARACSGALASGVRLAQALSQMNSQSSRGALQGPIIMYSQAV